MADTANKVTLIINWGAAGWSESYYVMGAVGAKKLTDKINRLISARACLFAATGVNARNKPIVQYVRISIVGAPNKGKPSPVPDQLQDIDSGVSPGDRRNYPYATGYVGNRHRTIKLKGAPSQWIPGDADERYGTIRPNMKAKFEFFAKVLVDDGWGMLLTAAMPMLNVTAAQVTDKGYLLLEVPGLVKEVNTPIILRGMTGSGTKRLNGRMRVKELLTGNQFVTNRKQCDNCVFDPLTGGTVSLVGAKTVSGFDEVLFTGWSSGKLGRAFFLDHGRQPACCR